MNGLGMDNAEIKRWPCDTQKKERKEKHNVLDCGVMRNEGMVGDDGAGLVCRRWKPKLSSEPSDAANGACGGKEGMDEDG
jgi:hypothetical protein